MEGILQYHIDDHKDRMTILSEKCENKIEHYKVF